MLSSCQADTSPVTVDCTLSVVHACILSLPTTHRSALGTPTGSTSLVSLRTVCAGLTPALCPRGVQLLRTLSDGAGGFLPGVPLESSDTGITFEAPAYPALRDYQPHV
jgi:hypothetical protein